MAKKGHCAARNARLETAFLAKAAATRAMRGPAQAGPAEAKRIRRDRGPVTMDPQPHLLSGTTARRLSLSTKRRGERVHLY